MKELPLAKAFQLIEPGPVVLVTTAHKQKANIMTLSWHMVMDFTPQIAFDREHANVLANALEFCVGQVLNLFRQGHTSGFADFAGTSTTDAENGGQADLGVLMRRNVDASYTSHDCSLM